MEETGSRLGRKVSLVCEGESWFVKSRSDVLGIVTCLRFNAMRKKTF